MDKNKILVITNDTKLSQSLNNNLSTQNLEIKIIENDSNINHKIKLFEPNLIILDSSQKDINSLEICKSIKQTIEIPVIFISSNHDEIDKILSLEICADDFLHIPFDYKELIARINSILRRTKDDLTCNNSKIIAYDNFYINIANYELIIKGKRVHIPAKQLELLYFLASSPNKIFSRKTLLENVWGFEYYSDARTVNVHIKKIRNILKDASDEWSLKTVYGQGYMFHVNIT